MNTHEFLNKYKLNPEAVDMKDVTNTFLQEMSMGLFHKDRQSSLPMLVNYCSDEVLIEPESSIIVIDMGGTNFRTCLVSFDKNKKATISDYQKTRMPGVCSEVSAKEFFSAIADETERLLPKSNRIGFCFSYAAETTADLDGVCLFFSKEVKAPEVVGKPIGAELLKELSRRGHDVSDYKVAVVNDTVATLLAGMAGSVGKTYSSYVGFILGTGTNTAYVEQAERINKVEDKHGLKRMIINVESGNFNYSVSEIDEQFRATTVDPSFYSFEKMISGAYLGPLVQFVIHKAIEEGIFSEIFVDKFDTIDTIDTVKLSEFLDSPFKTDNPLGFCVMDVPKDRIALYKILDAFVARSAKLTACNLAAAILKSGQGLDPTMPVCINADGTTFYRLRNLKRYTDMYLYEFLTKECRCYYDLINISDSPIIGSAIAAFCLK